MKKTSLIATLKDINKKYFLFLLTEISSWANKILPVRQRTEVIANLKRNWFLPISAMAFFFLTVYYNLGYYIGLPIAFVIMVIVSGQVSSLWSITKQQSLSTKILCAIGAVGICLGNQRHFYGETLKLTSKIELPEIFNNLILAVSYIGAAVAVFFVFFCLLLFWKEMKRIVSKSCIVDNVTLSEWIIYGLLLMGSLGLMAFSFAKSEAFYGTQFLYDIIYTSDSPDLVKNNVYLALTHTENDLRQPLFAVFAAPFISIPYLTSRLVSGSVTVCAMLMNSVQIIMLFITNLMLARMMKFDSPKRICFMILTSCTYTHLLFILMMEQYVVAYFWLILCIYLIVEKKPDRVALLGAGGTLLTSMVLLPFISDKSPIKDFKAWLVDMVKNILIFVAVILAFCRFDIAYNLISRISLLSRFAGQSVAFVDRFYQYTEFICNCFVAPNAGVNTTAFDYISWQLIPAKQINFNGVLIMILAAVSAIWNKDKRSSLLAAIWVGFSVIILLLLGWGTKENGLILYALYFGWAFIALIFQLIEKLEEKLKVRFLLPIITACVVAMLLVINIPSIRELINFAICYYSV